MEKASISFISYKFGHHVASLALPWIALLVMVSSVSIEVVSSAARVTSVKSGKGGSLSDRTPGAPGFEKISLSFFKREAFLQFPINCHFLSFSAVLLSSYFLR